MGKKRSQSMKTVSVKLLIPLFLSLAGLLTVLVWGMSENRKLIYKYIEDTAELYVEQINRDISQINGDLVWQMGKGNEIASLPADTGPADGSWYPLWRSMLDQNRLLKTRYTEVNSFYVYWQEPEVLATDAGMTFAQSDRSELTEALMGFLGEFASADSQSVGWRLLHTGDGDYIVSAYARGKRAMGCVIDLGTIFTQLRKGIREYEVIPFLEGQDGLMVLPDGTGESEREAILNFAAGKQAQFYQFRLGSVGMLNLYVVPGGGILERVLTMQLVFSILSVFFLCACGVEVYFYYNRIMDPMKRFVQGLNEMEEQRLHEDGTNNLLELESVSGRFRELLRKIQSLKIAIYEKELDEKRVELEYTQEQIKPHFFLNCLSLIHGIADARREERIVRITEVLSDYMRYMFKDGKKQRRIGEELAHIESYVEIQKLRYGEEAFTFESFLDGEVENCLVPALLLQTLVENAIVHTVTLERPIEISLYATEESYGGKEYLYICVSDTGCGFSDEILEAIREGKPIVYQGRKHVGLQNVGRRLELLYGKNGSLACSNMDENYGAVVEVRLPREV